MFRQCQGQLAQLAAERSEAAAAAKRGLEDNARLEKQLADARRKVCLVMSFHVLSCRVMSYVMSYHLSSLLAAPCVGACRGGGRLVVLGW